MLSTPSYIQTHTLKYASQVSPSTSAQSSETPMYSIVQGNNDSWKGDIMPVCRSAHFMTQEGRKYCEFDLLKKAENDAYYIGILRRAFLNQQQNFTSIKMTSNLERNRAMSQLVKIQKYGHLSDQALHLAVRMADQYLLENPLKGTQLAVLGCVCLWIASKIEDVTTPKFRFWVTCGQRFLEEQLTSMQPKVLQFFNFDFDIPTPLTFFYLMLPQIKLQQRTYYLCKYLMDLSLLDSGFLQFSPRVITLSSIYVAMQITDPLKWNQERYCDFLKVKSQDLKKCATLLIKNIVEASKMIHNEVSGKYCSDECFKISKITFKKAIHH